jgi:hypothetical protein
MVMCRLHPWCCSGCANTAASIALVTLVPARLQPGDPRPDAFDLAGGGLDLARLSGSIPAPHAAVLARERSMFRQLAAATPAPVMEVCVACNVVLAAAVLPSSACRLHAVMPPHRTDVPGLSQAHCISTVHMLARRPVVSRALHRWEDA